MARVVEYLRTSELIQLGQPLAIGAPRFHGHPPFMYSLTSRHGEGPAVPGLDSRISGAADAFAMGIHTGTHMDSLSHIAVDGCLHDGTNVLADGVQDHARGIRVDGGQAIRPILAPGVLLDFPAMLGVERVPETYDITPDLIDRCVEWAGDEIAPGDVVLVRTGWDTLWDDAAQYLSPEMPGPTPEAARYLVERGVVATGSDTMAYERAPGDKPLAVHAILLVEGGVFIIECLNLAELSRRRIHRFLFSAHPLQVTGATGSPINPVAIVPRAPSSP
ncbi:MAG TPA: cyclase family protein [Baekduia sp.]|nr:cyclase family protein [Baekduia sp.]